MYNRWEDLLLDRGVDLVVIATPPNLHREMATQAARHGKHILLEKPGGQSPRDIEEVCSEARHQGVLASINFVMRFHPYYGLVKDMVRSGVLGRLERVRIDNEAHGDLPENHWFWREEESGGIFVEHGIHFFDLCLWMLGPAIGVQAVALNSRGWGNTPDRVFASVVHRVSGADAVQPAEDRAPHPLPVLAQHYHAFTRPSAMGQAEAVFTFERGYLRLKGWIPVELELDAFADTHALDYFKGRGISGFSASESLGPEGRWLSSGTVFFHATHRIKLHLHHDNYEEMYSQCIRDSVANLISAIRKQSARALTAPLEAAREAMKVAIAARDASRKLA